MSQTTTTSPAGSSAPTTDPAGTYSGPGASAPTLADPGTYIPVTGATSTAAEIVDLPGSYSLAGAREPTLAQPGYYVPTAGASSETPVSPGYYQPNYGATTEFLALPPTISGTVAGQTTASGQSDTPFATVTIADPNIDTSDTLSIQLTDGGGILSDGVGFNGLTTIAPGLYSLSGTAGAITTELDALAFSPSGNPPTTTFTLTDTSSARTDAVDTNTAVTVLSTNPVADQSALDRTVGGLDGPVAVSTSTYLADQLTQSLAAAGELPSIALTDPSPLTLTITIAQALNDAIAIGEFASPHSVALADTAADVAAITPDQASALQAAGYESIASTTGAVTMTFAEAHLLISDGLAVTGARLDSNRHDRPDAGPDRGSEREPHGERLRADGFGLGGGHRVPYDPSDRRAGQHADVDADGG